MRSCLPDLYLCTVVEYIWYGAMAEELGKGLQNLLHGCESRSRLHLGGWRNWYTLRT